MRTSLRMRSAGVDVDPDLLKERFLSTFWNNRKPEISKSDGGIKGSDKDVAATNLLACFMI